MSVHTRLAILKRAEHYLQRAGYASFSFRTIAADLGIKSASVHYHFRSKEELGVALLDGYRAKFDAWVLTRSTKRDAHLELVEWFRYWSALSRGGAICPGGAFSAELTALPTRVRHALAQLQQTEREWLIATLSRGRKAKQIQLHGAVEDQANLILATLQGGVQLARVAGDAKVFSNVLSQLKLTILA